MLSPMEYVVASAVVPAGTAYNPVEVQRRILAKKISVCGKDQVLLAVN